MTHTAERLENAVKNWWLLLVLGAGMALLGIWVIRNPGGTLLGLAQFFNIMFLISGLLSISFALSNRDSMHGWGWTLAVGILEVLLAIVLLRHPAITGLALNFLLGFWLMFRGFYLISTSFELRQFKVQNWGWVLVGGILSTLLAFFVLVNPFTGAVAIAIWAGLSLIASGAFTIIFALGLRNIKHRIGNIRDAIGTE